MAQQAKERPAYRVRVDQDLLVAAQRADQLRVVGQRAVVVNNRTFIVLAAQTPSTSRQGPGFCGAGSEDRLLLTEWLSDRRQLLLRDALLVQSCLQTLSLWSDAGGDAFAALTSNADPARMQWSWVQHPTYGDRPVSVSIESARFAIKPAQPVPDSEKDH